LLEEFPMMVGILDREGESFRESHGRIAALPKGVLKGRGEFERMIGPTNGGSQSVLIAKRHGL
jgi:hypothetical protein